MRIEYGIVYLFLDQLQNLENDNKPKMYRWNNLLNKVKERPTSRRVWGSRLHKVASEVPFD